MRKLSDAVTRFLRAGLPGLGLLALAACGGPAPDRAPAPTQPRAADPGPVAEAGFDPAGRVTIALLVPSGGGDAERNALGASLVSAAKLAQGDLVGVSLDLRVFETGGDPARAKAAAEKAIAEGARLIVGPLFGQEAQAVGPVAAAKGINVLTFSTTPSAAARNVFLLGQTAETEAARLLAYAKAQGIGTVSVFHPASPTGVAAAEAVKAAARKSGLTLVTVADYPRSFQGIQDRAKEYAAIHSADALVLPEGGQGLVSVAAFLSYHGLGPRKTRFLGLGQWNAPLTQKEAALQGGWFVAPDPALFAAFADRYRAATGTEPTPIASLAYDGIAATGAMLREARQTGARNAFSAEAITDPQGFAGVNGIFRLRPDGRIDRALAVMEVSPDGFRVLDPAPRSFAAPDA